MDKQVSEMENDIPSERLKRIQAELYHRKIDFLRKVNLPK